MLTSILFQLYKSNNPINVSISIILISFLMVLFLISLYLYRKSTVIKQSISPGEDLINSLCLNIDDIYLIYHLGRHALEYVSPNCGRILGISKKSFMKNPLILLNYIEHESKDNIKELFTAKIFRTNFEAEIKIQNPKNHRVRWFMIKIYPVKSKHTIHIIRYIICISDLTNIKQTQQSLNEALINAQKANEAKKDFLSHMSHEIRNLVNAISGMNRIAAHSLDDKEKTKHCLDTISEVSNNLVTIVNNILDLSKIDSQKLILAKQLFSLRELLKSVEKMVRYQAELNHLQFSLEFKAVKHDDLLGDALRVMQILTNCISNSLKFTPPGGNIQLEVIEKEPYGDRTLYRFIIIDNGKGMSEEYVNHIFIPFEQEDSSILQQYGGSGLGMSITKNLVSLMEGEIQVRSKPDAGTTTIIDLPFTIANEKKVPVTKQMEEVVFSDYDFTGHHILIVEDNEINLEIACEYLKNTKVSIDTARSGRDALKLFEASEAFYYDIILMDIQMPGLNGYETTRLIRSISRPDAGKVCIIAMSAASNVEDFQLSYENGMDYHIVKPIDSKSFYRLISKVMNDSENDT